VKVFIIQKVGWEYNDEYYYRAESEGGKPQKAFKDRAAAEAECLKLNLKAFDDHQGYLGCYVPEFYEVEDQLKQAGCTIKDWDFDPPPNADDSTKLKIMTILNAVFYEIVPVELE
jgi:hypothetical protein